MAKKNLSTKDNTLKTILVLGGLCLLLVGFYFYNKRGGNLDGSNENVAAGTEKDGVKQEPSDAPPENLTYVFIENVPFTSQAPFGDWKDPRQQDGCEEASVLMAMRWVKGESLTKEQALEEILAMSKFEEDKYGDYHDTSSEDTVKRLFNDYYSYDKVKTVFDIKIEDIKKELAAGHLVIVPADGQKLGNPNFTGAGPERHKLVIRGYDDKKSQFITNDPGTRKGEKYRYDYDVLINAVRDYLTGYKVPIVGERKAMIV